MAFKKLNKLQKWLLKIKNPEAYRDYKFLLALQQVPNDLPHTDLSFKTEVHFKHSGNAGDIIYSLPAVFALAQGRDIHFHLHINQPAFYSKMYHPLKNVMLDENTVTFLKPLLLNQPGIKTCEVHNDGPVDIDLDIFRKYPFNYRTGNSVRWYFLTFGINADLNNPWLKAIPDNTLNDAIVIARSHRYRAPGIDYSFLQQYPRKVFIGLKEEYEDIKKMIPDIEYKPVKDFLEMASVIAGSRLFIGNQSFPFSIAEGLKCKRLLEVYHLCPNVNVEGAKGYDFCYQPQFEKLVYELYREE